MDFETKAILLSQDSKLKTGAVITPIFQTSTYAYAKPGQEQDFIYSRTNNPTREIVARVLAELEDAKYGLCYPSGMSAISSILALLEPGDELISSSDLYSGSINLFEDIFAKLQIRCIYVDPNDTKNFEKAITPKTKLIWLETPGNPLLMLSDIKEVAKIAKLHKLLVAVDNTFATPYFQRPLNMGADLVVHSTTKYLGGHSDVVGGSIATNNEELFTTLKMHQKFMGNIAAPFDCWLVQRGIKTLAVRMRQHQINGIKVAEFLASNEMQSKVNVVNYPLLKSHPQHALAKKQMTGFSGIMSFEINTESIETINKFISNMKIFTLAESLGGVESLLGHPMIMSHGSVSAEWRKKYGIKNNLIRLSVGIEDADDLIQDIKGAFRAAFPS